MSEHDEIVRAIFDNCEFFTFAIGRDGVCTFIEGRAAAELGDLGAFRNANIYEMLGPDSPIAVAVRRVLAGETFTTQFELAGRVLQVRYAPLRDAAAVDRIKGAVGIAIDITELVLAQQDSVRTAQRLREKNDLLDLARDAILMRRPDGTLTYWNRGAEQLYGYTADEAVGAVSHVLLQTVFPVDAREIDRQLLAEGHWEGDLMHRRRDGSQVYVSSRWMLRRDEHGAVLEMFEINTDITARRAAEEAQKQRQEEIIRAQAHAIAELSTPMIPITDGVLVMPLIGMMDSMRAKQVMDALLSGLAQNRGRVAILDITGVPVVDTATANALIQAAHAARLLGAEVILTGIRPEVAQTLVTLDAKLGSITTRGTLQSAIELVLGRRRLGGA
ncbi:MAG TPA: PAS domain-containing protein [Nannocystis sp.]|jgi:rsbT co-antagonist protein RsbR